MTIETVNDGKGKPQSWTACADMVDSTYNQSWSIILTAYGPTEAKAIDNLNLAARRAASDLVQSFDINAR